MIISAIRSVAKFVIHFHPRNRPASRARVKFSFGRVSKARPFNGSKLIYQRMLQFPHQPRFLREEEKVLLKTMLASRFDVLPQTLDKVLVQDMNDGGMGSIEFLPDSVKSPSSARMLTDAEYMDEDGVPALITIYLDPQSRLNEVDFWKVDFSPLKRFPKQDQLCQE